jgi:hypothetical protein
MMWMPNEAETQLLSLKARAMALQNRLFDLEQQRDKGFMEMGQFTRLAGTLDHERIKILEQLRQETVGKDARFDSVVDRAILNAPEEQDRIRDELFKVAQEKGLGAEIKEKVAEHKGAIISTLIDVGLGLLGKATS